MMALNAKTENATLNIKLGSDDGFERRNWEVVMALNAETENVTLNVKLRRDDGSEHRNWEAMMMTLNPETEKYDSEHQTEDRWWL